MIRERFARECPGVFFLDAEDPASLAAYLRDRGWLGAQEKILALEKAGEGNMNLTLRLTSSERSLIVKQARPWVEKYPDFAAPRDRARVEGAYLELVQGDPELAAFSPRLLGQDEEACLLLIEDLGQSEDLSSVYRDGRMDRDLLQQSLDYLARLHTFSRGHKLPEVLVNREMRALNHTHIFDLPLRPENGIDLEAFTPGLTRAAAALIDDADFVARVRELGERYLSDGPALVHGDFYPGSFLQTERGLAVIDAEFCFPGFPEFDYGVLLAHLTLAGVAEDLADEISQAPVAAEADPNLTAQIAGVEITRRLIGVAQLPLLEIDLARKTRLLELARYWVMT